MNIWANTVLTDNGRALMAKLTQGNTLYITRAVTGTAFVAPDLLAQQTAVADQKQELAFRPVSYPDTGQCAITATLSNAGLGTGYTANQVGIYAADPDLGEVLLFISQAIDAESGTVVPSETEMAGFSTDWTFYLKYGQADGVTLTVDPGNTISREEMETYVAQVMENVGGKRSARFTIGTSLAGWTKKDCDYLCDGTDDEMELQEAINALPDSGGEIVLLDGQYNIKAPFFISKANVTLSGNGASTTLHSYGNGENDELIIVHAENVTIRGLKIDCSTECISAIYVNRRHCTIVDNEIVGGSAAIGILLLTGGSGHFVSRNRITDFLAGIHTAADDSTISGNSVSDCTNYGILADHVARNIITGNTVTNCNINLCLNNSNKCIVTSNIAYSGLADGSAVIITGVNTYGHIIANNIVDDAMDSDAPTEFPVNKIVAGTADITAGSSLDTGTLYLVYE